MGASLCTGMQIYSKGECVPQRVPKATGRGCRVIHPTVAIGWTTLAGVLARDRTSPSASPLAYASEMGKGASPLHRQITEHAGIDRRGTFDHWGDSKVRGAGRSGASQPRALGWVHDQPAYRLSKGPHVGRGHE